MAMAHPGTQKLLEPNQSNLVASIAALHIAKMGITNELAL
jgi:hypothetical protein